MKRFIKITLSLLLVCIIASSMAVHFFADTIFTDKGFSYTVLNGNFASICGWDGGSTVLEIPLQLNDSYVREIAGWCFNERTDFYTVNFGQADYLNAIGVMAFADCTALSETLDIPPQVRSVGLGAFQGCSSIEVLNYDANSGSIPTQCFYNCSSLKEAYLTDGIESIGQLAFANCGSLEVVRIPESVTSINSSAFNNSPNTVIYCYYDTYAHRFAEDYGFDFVIIDSENVPTDPPTDAPVGYLLGDTDDNDDVEVVDATWLQRYIALMNIGVIEDTVMQGDVDGDGDPSIVDATFIMRYCVGIDTPFDIGELVV